METKKIWTWEYECSSDKEFRMFTQIAYPLRSGLGLILVNRIRLQKNMGEATGHFSNPNLEEYLQKNGLIYQCSNCRCVERKETKSWDWVPDWVVEIPRNTSHTICFTCEQYFWKLGALSKL